MYKNIREGRVSNEILFDGKGLVKISRGEINRRLISGKQKRNYRTSESLE